MLKSNFVEMLQISIDYSDQSENFSKFYFQANRIKKKAVQHSQKKESGKSADCFVLNYFKFDLFPEVFINVLMFKCGLVCDFFIDVPGVWYFL